MNFDNIFENLRKKLFMLRYESVNQKLTSRSKEEIEKEIKGVKQEIAKNLTLQKECVHNNYKETERKNNK